MKLTGICFSVVIIFSSSLETSSLDSGEICQTPENAHGTCLGIRECSYFADQLTKLPVPQSLLSTLKKSVCGNRDEKPLICCPSDTTSYLVPSSATDMDNLNGEKGDRCKTPFDEHGQCIPIKDCPVLTDLFQDKDSSTIALNVELIMRSRCGMLRTETLYCCPNLLDQSNCGSAISSKFPEDNGNKTEVFDFPWLALIYYKPNVRFKCAGSIINSRYVLTAAKCAPKLKSDLEPYYVRLGEYNLETERDCKGDICAPPPQDIAVEKVIVHPAYQKRGRKYSDIALLRLSKDVDFSSNAVRPVCLPKGLSNPTEDFDGKALLSTAITRDEAPVFTKNIVKGISADQCSKHVENVLQISHVSHLCTVPDKGDDCSSVSGSPLLHYETDKGRNMAIQYGIISFGFLFCGSGAPTGYTNVNHFMEWIIDNVEA